MRITRILFGLFWFLMLQGMFLGTQINLYSQDNTLTNQAAVVTPERKLSHLERYEQNTQEHWLRRTELTFFIAIPFSLLWANFNVDVLKNFSVLGATIDGVRGSQLQSGNFNYYHEDFPTLVVDPFYLFKWISATIWPAAIAANSFIERGWDPATIRDFKSHMKQNRFKLNLIYQPSF